MIRGTLAFIAIAWLIPLARADEARPNMRPGRDVEVIYDVPHGGQTVQERTRWQGATGLQRLDTPQGGTQYAIADQGAGTVRVVNDAQRVVVSVKTPRGPLNGGAARFRRLGTLTVAGLPCTEWEVAPPQPGAELDQICLTDDGLMLNIRADGVQRARAASVRYGRLDPALFLTPAGYRQVQPPGHIAPSP